MYRAMRGLDGPQLRAALDEFTVAADEYWRLERNSPDHRDQGYR
jgi:hypothetical protein